MSDFPPPRPGLAVAVSPHLDDAVFSAGGTLAVLAAAGWTVRVVTCFTQSVAGPSPFALSTQLDKGLPAEADYMAIRRVEDERACAVLGAQPVHLRLPEAPHRGYGSAAELFAGRRSDDTVGDVLRDMLTRHLGTADLVLAPQALGDHVDHQVVADVVAIARPDALWWRDTPYVLRRPDAPAWPAVAAGPELAVAVHDRIDVKITAACCYRTQLAFQFGGAQNVGPRLRGLAATEATRTGQAVATEAFTRPAHPTADR